ncbi:hypothetical protein FRC11_000894 [Ceratobasidium sp. 423]|nr:hypothetical protein FRC11_000894 [Ceratobasidium sp. 423]
MRGEWDKAVLAYGFEKENGYKAMISTEAFTMGLDYRRIKRVIQVLACSDLETALQRGGYAGRDPAMEADIVFMIQDSMFNDSKEGQKRAAKDEQQNPIELAASKKAITLKGKNKSSAKTYSDSIRKFINAPGCLVEVIDKEFDNPPRPEEKCLCEYHKKLRGEPTLREQMHAIKMEVEKVAKENQVEDTMDMPEQTISRENNGDKVEEVKNDVSNPTGLKMRTKAKAKPYRDALEAWLDQKYTSNECRCWNVRKHWLLPDKVLERLSKDPGITTTNHLDSLKPTWNYRQRWGAEVLQVLQDVADRLEAERIAQEAEKRLALEEKQRKTEEALRQAKAKRQETQKRRHMEDEQLQQSLTQAAVPTESSSTSFPLVPLDPSANPHPPKRPRLPNLPKDATEEQKKECKDLLAANKRARQCEKYRLNKIKNEEIKQESSDASVPGPSTPTQSSLPSGSILGHVPSLSSLQTPPILDRIAKEELVDNSEQLLASESQVELDRPSPASRSIAPATPHTPISIPRLDSNPEIPGTTGYQYPTPWSMAANIPMFSLAPSVDQSPSILPRHHRPKPRPIPEQGNSPNVPPS